MNSEVRVANLQKKYSLGSNEVWALRGVSLEIKAGEFLALAGSSGSGKSTLLNLIGCLDAPSAGEIFIGERNIGQMSSLDLARFRAEHLGFIFQTFNLLPVLSAMENVEYPLLKRRLHRSEREALALKALAQVGLEKFGHHRPDQLSGGQRQRVAIARALVHKPQLIIADEPTANLDKATATGIMEVLGELNKNFKVTIVIASHDSLVLDRTGRVVHLSDGQIQ